MPITKEVLQSFIDFSIEQHQQYPNAGIDFTQPWPDQNNKVYDPEQLPDTDFSGLNIFKGEFKFPMNCNFKGLNLRGTKFGEMTIIGANFQGADLSDADLRNTKFESCNFVDAKFSLVYTIKSFDEIPFFDTCIFNQEIIKNFSGRILNIRNVRNLDLRNIDISRWSIDVRPDSGDLVGCKVTISQLTQLVENELSGEEEVKGEQYLVNGRGLVLEKLTLDDIDLSRIDFSSAKFNSCRLSKWCFAALLPQINKIIFRETYINFDFKTLRGFADRKTQKVLISCEGFIFGERAYDSILNEEYNFGSQKLTLQLTKEYFNQYPDIEFKNINLTPTTFKYYVTRDKKITLNNVNIVTLNTFDESALDLETFDNIANLAALKLNGVNITTGTFEAAFPHLKDCSRLLEGAIGGKNSLEEIIRKSATSPEAPYGMNFEFHEKTSQKISKEDLSQLIDWLSDKKIAYAKFHSDYNFPDDLSDIDLSVLGEENFKKLELAKHKINSFTLNALCDFILRGVVSLQQCNLKEVMFYKNWCALMGARVLEIHRAAFSWDSFKSLVEILNNSSIKIKITQCTLSMSGSGNEQVFYDLIFDLVKEEKLTLIVKEKECFRNYISFESVKALLAVDGLNIKIDGGIKINIATIQQIVEHSQQRVSFVKITSNLCDLSNIKSMTSDLSWLNQIRDCNGLTLSGAVFDYLVASVNINEINWSGVIFKEIDFSKFRPEKPLIIDRPIFDEASFNSFCVHCLENPNITLSNIIIEGLEENNNVHAGIEKYLVGATFSNTFLPKQFEKVIINDFSKYKIILKGARLPFDLTWVDFSKVNFSPEQLCFFNYVSWRAWSGYKLNMENIRFLIQNPGHPYHDILFVTDYSGLDLSGLNFSNVKFRLLSFQGANISQATFGPLCLSDPAMNVAPNAFENITLSQAAFGALCAIASLKESVYQHSLHFPVFGIARNNNTKEQFLDILKNCKQASFYCVEIFVDESNYRFQMSEQYEAIPEIFNNLQEILKAIVEVKKSSRVSIDKIKLSMRIFTNQRNTYVTNESLRWIFEATEFLNIELQQIPNTSPHLNTGAIGYLLRKRHHPLFGLLKNNQYDKLDLSNFNFGKIKFQDASFTKAKLIGTGFPESEFHGVSFDRTIFGETDFSDCIVENCSFNKAIYQGKIYLGKNYKQSKAVKFNAQNALKSKVNEYKKKSDVPPSQVLNDTLRDAAVNGEWQKIKEFFVDYRDANVNAQDEHGMTLLHWAAAFGQQTIVEGLINIFWADSNAKSHNGLTPLHCAALNGKYNVIQCLIENFHADVNATNQFGQTPLHLAMKENHGYCCKALLERNALQSAKDYANLTPLAYGVLHRSKSALDMWFQTLPGFGFNEFFLNLAAYVGDIEIFKMLVNKFNENTNPFKCDIAVPSSALMLFFAVVRGNNAMVLHLLNEYKIDVNCAVKDLTLLQYAIQAGHEETAQILRTRGAFIPEELEPKLAALVADIKEEEKQEESTDEEAEHKSKKIKLDSPQNWAAFWEEGEEETNKHQREDDTDATAKIGSSAKHQRTMQ